MKKAVLLFTLLVFCCVISCKKDDNTDTSPDPSPADTLEVPIGNFPKPDASTAHAFPGAEGGGMYATGGRGGDVYQVTKLTDDGSEGTFRWAVEQGGARTIVFLVSGTIELQSILNIRNDNITIAGQTAPGDGICIANYPVWIKCNNVIIRFVRFRLGDLSGDSNMAESGDALQGEGNNIIIDHCSMSWCMDECVTFYKVSKLTVQWCIISESLRNSIHPKGKHGYGGIWGGNNAAFHHNLLAHHDSRNPRFNGTRYGDGTDEKSTETVNFVNNILYNWGSNSAYGGEGKDNVVPVGGHYNMIANYYKYGPATNHKQRICEPYKPFGRYYVVNNFVYGSESVTKDNWKGFDEVTDEEKETMKLTEYIDGVTPVTVQTPQQAYESVLARAGASLNRDAVDTRIINEVSTQTATYGGASYTEDKGIAQSGIIDSQEDVGGFPLLNSETAPIDTDGDGMPDNWETANGLDINNPDDRNGYDLDDKFTNLEMYLNSLVSF